MNKKMLSVMMASVMAAGLTTGMALSAGAEETSINVCLASEPATLDPALNSAVDGATMTAHLFSGPAPPPDPQYPMSTVT